MVVNVTGRRTAPVLDPYPRPPSRRALAAVRDSARTTPDGVEIPRRAIAHGRGIRRRRGSAPLCCRAFHAVTGDRVVSSAHPLPSQRSRHSIHLFFLSNNSLHYNFGNNDLDSARSYSKGRDVRRACSLLFHPFKANLKTLPGVKAQPRQGPTVTHRGAFGNEDFGDSTMAVYAIERHSGIRLQRYPYGTPSPRTSDIHMHIESADSSARMSGHRTPDQLESPCAFSGTPNSLSRGWPIDKTFISCWFFESRSPSWCVSIAPCGKEISSYSPGRRR